MFFDLLVEFDAHCLPNGTSPRDIIALPLRPLAAAALDQNREVDGVGIENAASAVSWLEMGRYHASQDSAELRATVL